MIAQLISPPHSLLLQTAGLVTATSPAKHHISEMKKMLVCSLGWREDIKAVRCCCDGGANTCVYSGLQRIGDTEGMGDRKLGKLSILNDNDEAAPLAFFCASCVTKLIALIS